MAEGPDLGAVGFEQLACGRDRFRIDVDISQRPVHRSRGLDDEPGAFGHELGRRGLEDRDDADPARLVQGSTERVGDLGRAVRGFDEDLDRAVAAEPEAPDRVVVGGQIPAREPGSSLVHHHPSEIGHITLEAATADVADGCPFLGHEQPRSGAPVRGASHGHDRGERHPLATIGEGLDGGQDVGDLAHDRIVGQVRCCDTGSVCASDVPIDR